MARLWGELKAEDSTRVKETTRIASQAIETTLAVGSGSVYSHEWERHIWAQLGKDTDVSVAVHVNLEVVARIDIDPEGNIKVWKKEA